MNIVSVKCPNCGAVLEADKDLDAGICSFCGVPYVMEKAINHYSVANNIKDSTVNIYGGDSNYSEKLEKLVKIAVAIEESGQSAEEQWKEIIEEYPEDYRGWLGVLNTATRVEDFHQSFIRISALTDSQDAITEFHNKLHKLLPSLLKGITMQEYELLFKYGEADLKAGHKKAMEYIDSYLHGDLGDNLSKAILSLYSVTEPNGELPEYVQAIKIYDNIYFPIILNDQLFIENIEYRNGDVQFLNYITGRKISDIDAKVNDIALQDHEKQEKLARAEDKRRNRNDILHSVIGILKKFLPVAYVLAGLLMIWLLAVKLIIPFIEYQEAANYMKNKDYTEASRIYDDLGNFLDSNKKQLAAEAKQYEIDTYSLAKTYYDRQEYPNAISLLEEIPDYKDSAEFIKKCKYKYALEYMEKEDFKSAISLFEDIIDYEDAETLLADAKEKQAVADTIYNDSKLYSDALSDCNDGLLDDALIKIAKIENKSEVVLQFEQDVRDFQIKYQKWLGDFSYQPDGIPYVSIRATWNDGLKLLFDEGLETYDLIEESDNVLTFHSERFSPDLKLEINYIDENTLVLDYEHMDIEKDGVSLLADWTLYRKTNQDE